MEPETEVTPTEAPAAPPPEAVAETQETVEETPTSGPGAQEMARLVAAEKEKQASAARLKEQESEVTKMRELLRIAQTDPDRFAALTGKKPAEKKQDDPVAPLADKLSALEQKLLERERQETAQAQSKKFSEIETAVTTYVSEKSEKYPMVNALSFQGAVYDRIVDAARTGQALSEDQAASELEEALSAHLEKLAQIPALRDLVLKSKQSPEQGTQERTLSNDMTADTSSRAETELEDREASLERMAALLSKSLKS